MLTIVLPGARDCESEWAGSRPPLWLPTPSTKRARRHTRQDGAALTRDPWLNTCHGESPVSQPIHALAHVDDSGPDLDARGPCRYRREQSNRRCRLFGEVVDAEVRPVDADLIGADADLHCLLQRFPRAVGAAGGVMTETQESECLHAHTNLVECSIIPTGLTEPDPVRRLGLGSPGPSPREDSEGPVPERTGPWSAPPAGLEPATLRLTVECSAN